MNIKTQHGATPDAERKIAGILVRWANRYGVVATDAWREHGSWLLATVFGALTLREIAERIGEHDENFRTAA